MQIDIMVCKSTQAHAEFTVT